MLDVIMQNLDDKITNRTKGDEALRCDHVGEKQVFLFYSPGTVKCTCVFFSTSLRKN